MTFVTYELGEARGTIVSEKCQYIFWTQFYIFLHRINCKIEKVVLTRHAILVFRFLDLWCSPWKVFLGVGLEVLQETNPLAILLL